MQKVDIVPDLKKKIEDEFEDLIKDDEVLFQLAEKMKTKNASYIDADLYAQRIGELSSKSLLKHLTPDSLPDGTMYFNIGNRVLTPALQRDYELISDVCVEVQESLNEAARIGIKSQRAPFDTDRAKGFVDRASSEPLDDIQWLLDGPVKTFCQSVVGDHMEANAEFQKLAGLSPKIIRKTDGKCCKWCSRMAGVYDYSPDMNRAVFRKHEDCSCTVEYDPGDGSKRRQNVWEKTWK